MASEAADHMRCPLPAWYLSACMYNLHKQDDRTGALGGARPLSIVPVSHSVTYRVRAMKA